MTRGKSNCPPSLSNKNAIFPLPKSLCSPNYLCQGTTVPGSSARSAVVINSPIVRKRGSRSFLHLWGGRKGRRGVEAGFTAAATSKSPKSPSRSRRSSSRYDDSSAGELESFREDDGETLGEYSEVGRVPSRKGGRGPGIGARLVRMFACTRKPVRAPGIGSFVTVSNKQKASKKSNAKEADFVGRRVPSISISRGSSSKNLATGEARFGTGSPGRELSQLYGYPAPSIEQTHGTGCDNSSHGAERASSVHSLQVDKDDGGPRVQHLLRTSQLHSAKSKSASGRSDSSSELSARPRQTALAWESGDKTPVPYQ